MKINKLTASFGKLENETLSFHEGLNVIYAPNESGKTTWCAFIRAMLYGIDTSERAKGGVLPDKVKYAPWSGLPMEGTMELNSGGCDITLSRTTTAKNAPMREFSATYTGTNIPVEGIDGQNAGEMLTGVSKEVFRRSAFMGQGAVAVTGTPELEKRICSIVSTGEEETSYTQADETLRSWQRKRRYNNRGALPELEEEISETKNTLGEIEKMLTQSQELAEQLEESREKCTRLEQAVNDSRKRQRRDALDKLNHGRTALRQAEQEHDSALLRLSEAKDELRKNFFASQTPEEAAEEAGEDLAELKKLKTVGVKPLLPILSMLFFVLTIVGAALYTSYQKIVFIVAAVLFGAAAIWFTMRWIKRRSEYQQAQDRRREILRRYGVVSAGDIQTILEEHELLYRNTAEAFEAERECGRAYTHALELQQLLEADALGELDFASGSSEAAILSRSLGDERSNAEQLSSSLSALRGAIAASGDPTVLTGRLKYLEQEHEEISDEYEAIELAVQTLRSADTEIQGRFSPNLGELASRYMFLVTDGRYEDILINRDFTAKTKAAGDAVARPAEYLSAGTLDLMYIAVRLAVCELALPDGENCPLIIDDALVNLDETRFTQATELLREIAKGRQVILFTCRK